MPKDWLKKIASLLILFHLGTIILMPNFVSTYGRIVGQPFLVYASTFGITMPWMFFSPDPSVILYFEYELEVSDYGEPLTESEQKTYQWPIEPPDRFYRLDYLRSIYHSRSSTSSPERLEKLLIPFLCKKHPEAKRISVRSVIKTHPLLEQAEIEPTSETVKFLRTRKELPATAFSCNPESFQPHVEPEDSPARAFDLDNMDSISEDDLEQSAE